MERINITQNTSIAISFYKDTDKDTCEKIMDNITDILYENINTDLHPVDYTYSQRKDKINEYYLFLEEDGTIDYYSKSDDYDNSTVLDDSDYEDLIDDIRNSDIGENINTITLVYSDWTSYSNIEFC